MDISVGHNAAPQYHRIRISNPYQIHDKICQSFRSIFNQSHTQRISFLTQRKDFADQYPFSLFCRDMQIRFIPVAEKTGAIIKTDTGGNGLHTIHSSTTTLDAEVHPHTHMPHLTRVEVAATYLPAIDNRTDSNTCTYININKVLGNLSESPDTFGASGAFHIIIYMTGNTINIRQFLCQCYRLCPARINL